VCQIMQCKSCGKTINRRIDEMCADCYINSNLPTKVRNTPWVHAFSFARKKERKYEEADEKLASAITSMTARISEDKTTIVLDVNRKAVSIPVNVETLDELARKTGILAGKWLIYRGSSEIDDTWKTIARRTFSGELGTSAKAATAMQSKGRHVICVYTYDYLDLEDVMNVRERLKKLGLTDKLCYKPDIYTYLGIYHRTTTRSPCRYRN